ncbi:hypothetical protein COL8621_02362 [Actibacterium lipolyticum]|uniref:Uncharacterized protein n=1 Tax=Actibacterium lipolyticum TaxID=1524263 RepID=A0A238KM07_9RHOB|nr:hypothetical protein COL8621_02362 [Actibacterium lipolyticum]
MKAADEEYELKFVLLPANILHRAKRLPEAISCYAEFKRQAAGWTCMSAADNEYLIAFADYFEDQAMDAYFDGHVRSVQASTHVQLARQAS